MVMNVKPNEGQPLLPIAGRAKDASIWLNKIQHRAQAGKGGNGTMIGCEWDGGFEIEKFKTGR